MASQWLIEVFLNVNRPAFWSSVYLQYYYFFSSQEYVLCKVFPSEFALGQRSSPVFFSLAFMYDLLSS